MNVVSVLALHTSNSIACTWTNMASVMCISKKNQYITTYVDYEVKMAPTTNRMIITVCPQDYIV